MKRFPIFSFGILGRLIIIVLIAVVIELLINSYFYERAGHLQLRKDEAHRVAEHVVVTYRLMNDAAPRERYELADHLSNERHRILWHKAGTTRPRLHHPSSVIRQQMIAWEPDLATLGGEFAVGTDKAERIVRGHITLADKSWVEFHSLEVEVKSTLYQRIITGMIFAIMLIIIAAFLARRSLQPLRELALAAETYGSSKSRHLEARGPDDVRQVIHAFNAMKSRIAQLINDRTLALAAVGHDLRTPITRLKLRAEAIGDDELRQEVEDDLNEMDQMLTSVLTYLGDENYEEERRRVDLAVMVATFVNDLEDRDIAASYTGPDHLEMLLRPVAIKRALGNLIDNAVHYGKSVSITLQSHSDDAVLWIDDEGPGIPDAMMDIVIKPFERLDQARARNTKGMGLGLAIVSQVMTKEGGAFHLHNRPEGGLRAEIILPKAA